MRNYILLAVALVAGMLAFFLTKLQIESEYRKLDLLGAKIKVLTPRRDMLKGDVIQPSDLTVRTILAGDASRDIIEVTDVSKIVDQKLGVNKKRDTFFLWGDLEMPTLGWAGSALARTIKKKERALSVSVDLPSSVSAMIQPNDHIDILGTFRFPGDEKGALLDTVTLTILQNVTVLAVGQQIATLTGGQSTGERLRGYSTVTLAVTPKEAEMLVFAQQKGTLTFTLRNPTDPYIEGDVQNVNFNYLKANAAKYTEERSKRLELAPVRR